MSTVFQIKPVSWPFVEVFRYTMAILLSFHAQNFYRTCAYAKRVASFRDRSEVDRWVLHDCCVDHACLFIDPCHALLPFQSTSPCHAELFKQVDIRQWHTNPLIIFWVNILNYLVRIHPILYWLGHKRLSSMGTVLWCRGVDPSLALLSKWEPHKWIF